MRMFLVETWSVYFCSLFVFPFLLIPVGKHIKRKRKRLFQRIFKHQPARPKITRCRDHCHNYFSSIHDGPEQSFLSASDLGSVKKTSEMSNFENNGKFHESFQKPVFTLILLGSTDHQVTSLAATNS